VPQTDLEEATEFYELWKAAYRAVTSGQSYEINTGGSVRKLTRVDAAMTKTEMFYWKNEINKINTGRRGLGVKFGTPHR